MFRGRNGLSVRQQSASALSGFGATAFALSLACRAEARRASAERRLVAREGLEPSKAQGRQIYSLLRLTASLPRRYRVLTFQRTPTAALTAENLPSILCVFVRIAPCRPLTSARTLEAEAWSWRRDLNPRPADYKSAALPD